MDKETARIIDTMIHTGKIIKRDESQQATHRAKQRSQPSGKLSPAQQEAYLYLQSAKLATSDMKLQIYQSGRLSAARSGIAFVEFTPGHEVLIPSEKRGNSLHRDMVEVRVTGFQRGRFIGSVEKIKTPFSQKFLARSLRRDLSGKYHFVELCDLPDKPLTLVASEKEKLSEYFYVDRGADVADVVDLLKESGRIRRRLPLYTLSDQKFGESRLGDLERLQIRFQLPLDYPKSVVPDKKTLNKKTSVEFKSKHRRHFTKEYIYTIDGADAKDFDDAISVEKNKQGFQLFVHIADVSFFVEKNSALEKEAIRRGNSYYLAGSVIPMLPEILSNDFCSLRPKTTRLAFSVEMNYDHSGHLIDYSVFRSVIKLKKRYTYEDAEKDLAKKKSPLASAWELAELLMAQRNAKGRIELEIPETKAILDRKGNVTSLSKRARLNSHRLVEEFMLSANAAVAQFCIKHKIGILHRNHESMPVDKLDRLNRYLEINAAHLKLKSADSKEINGILKRPELDKIRDVFQILLLRSFMQANYAAESKGHWGLAFQEYCHFTSPIRRFADLVVHRQLGHYLERKTPAYDADTLGNFGVETSRLERIAFEAEKADGRLIAVRLLEKSVGQEFDAWFSSFNQEKIFIQLETISVEGAIYGEDLDRRGEIKVLNDFSVFLGKFQKTIYLGQRFRVKLVKADPIEMQLRFKLMKVY